MSSDDGVSAVPAPDEPGVAVIATASAQTTRKRKPFTLNQDVHIPLQRVLFDWLLSKWVTVLGNGGDTPYKEEDCTEWMLYNLRLVWPDREFSEADFETAYVHTHRESALAHELRIFLTKQTKMELEFTLLKQLFSKDRCLNPFMAIGLVGYARTPSSGKKKGSRFVVSFSGEGVNKICAVPVSAFEKLPPVQVACFQPHEKGVIIGSVLFVSLHLSFVDVDDGLKPVVCGKSVRASFGKDRALSAKTTRWMCREVEPDSDYDSTPEDGDEANSDVCGDDDVREGDMDAVGGVRRRVRQVRKGKPVAVYGAKQSGKRKARKVRRVRVEGGEEIHTRALDFLATLPSVSVDTPAQGLVATGLEVVRLLRGSPSFFKDFLEAAHLEDVKGAVERKKKMQTVLSGDMSAMGEILCHLADASEKERLSSFYYLMNKERNAAFALKVDFSGENLGESKGAQEGRYMLPKPFVKLIRSSLARGNQINELHKILRTLRDPLLIWIFLKRVVNPLRSYTQVHQISAGNFLRRIVAALSEECDIWRIYLRFGREYTDAGTNFDKVKRIFCRLQDDTVFVKYAPPGLKAELDREVETSAKTLPMSCALYESYAVIEKHPDYSAFEQASAMDPDVHRWNMRNIREDPGPVLEKCERAICIAESAQRAMEARIVEKHESRPTGAVMGRFDMT